MLFIGEQMGILGGSHLLDHKKTRGDYKMIKWLGFSKKENTWEPLINCYED